MNENHLFTSSKINKEIQQNQRRIADDVSDDEWPWLVKLNIGLRPKLSCLVSVFGLCKRLIQTMKWCSVLFDPRTTVKSNSVQTMMPAASPLNSFMPFKDHSKHVTDDWWKLETEYDFTLCNQTWHARHVKSICYHPSPAPPPPLPPLGHICDIRGASREKLDKNI